MVEPVSASLLAAAAKSVGGAGARFAAKTLLRLGFGTPEERALRAVITDAREAATSRLAGDDRQRRRELHAPLEEMGKVSGFEECLIALALGQRTAAADIETLVLIAQQGIDTSTLGQDLEEIVQVFLEEVTSGLAADAGRSDSKLSQFVILARLDELAERLGDTTKPPVPDMVAAHAAMQAERALKRLVGAHVLRPTASDSPLEPFWREFLEASTWDEEVEEAVRRLLDALDPRDGTEPRVAANELRERCEELDLSADYPTIAADLADVVELGLRLVADLEAEASSEDASRRLRGAIRKLQLMLSSPSYRRCLLVAGSSGEGKTHFVAELLSTAADDPEELVVLLLERPLPPGGAIRDALREQAREITGHPWPSWEDLARHCAEQGIWLVIVIEDLEAWAERTPQGLEALQDEVTRSSGLGRVRWLITADLSGLERLIAREFWLRYGWTELTLAGGQAPLRPVAGWHVLDPMNVAHETGIEILRARTSPRSLPTLVELADSDDPEVYDSVRRLSVPLVAWLVHEISVELGEPLERLLDVNSIDLIARFTETLYRRLEGGPNHTIADVEVAIALAADVIARQPSDDIALGRLVAGVVERGKAEGSSVSDERTAGAALTEATRRGLLTSGDGQDPIAPEPVVRLRYEFVWDRLIAGRVIRACGGSAQLDIEQLVSALDLPDARRRERVTVLALLIADSAGREQGRSAKAVWSAALEAEDLPESAVWFAAAKADRETQEELMELAQRVPEAELQRRTVFALLHFLGDAGLATGQPVRSLEAIKPFYADVGEHQLSEYFRFVAERLLRRIHRPGDLIEALRALVGCEAAGPPADLGSIAVEAVARVCPDARDAIALSIDFLTSLRDMTTRSPTGAPRGTFHECYIHDLAGWVAQSGGIMAYDWFRGLGWYDAGGEHADIDRHLAHRMRTEANVALGAWYREVRNGSAADSYVETVERLSSGPHAGGFADSRDRINAIYLMLHTIPEHVRRRQPTISQRFHPSLLVLVKDPDRDVQAEVRKQQRLFETNIPGRMRSHGGRRPRGH